MFSFGPTVVIKPKVLQLGVVAGESYNESPEAEALGQNTEAGADTDL